jgi:hypothetical protein
MALYCNGFLCGDENHTIFSLYRVKQVLLENNFPINDVNKETVKKFLSQYFEADYMIGGHYSVENNILMSYIYNTDIHNPDNNKYEFVKAHFTMDDFAALDTILFPVISRLTGAARDSEIITINSDMRCSLYINDNYFQELPVTLRLRTGTYDVKIIFENESEKETIYDKAMTVVKGKSQQLDIPVFTSISIQAGKQCMVIIDGEEMGTTPFESKLFSGQQYKMKIVYTDEDSFRWEVDSKIISTKEYKPLSFSYSDEAAIRFVNHHGRLAGRIDNDPFGELQDYISNIEPGSFRLQLALPEPEKGKYWLLYDKRRKLHPFEILTIDCSNISYQKNLGMCFLPSAAQFYNREYTKAWTVLSLSLSLSPPQY